MLTIADGGGGGVQEPLILADVICEQPLAAGKLGTYSDSSTHELSKNHIEK